MIADGEIFGQTSAFVWSDKAQAIHGNQLATHVTTLTNPCINLGKGVPVRKTAVLLDFVQMRGGRAVPKFFGTFSVDLPLLKSIQQI